MDGSVVALHAESVPSDPTVLRWAVSDGLPGTGRLVAAPGALGVLLGPAGPIVRAVAERGALWTWLADAEWPRFGVAVRDALIAALESPDQWCFDPADDEVLLLVARDVIEGSLGDYIASHGGQISVLSATDHRVEVRLSGTCANCPAAGLTLHQRLEQQLRQRTGDQSVVCAEPAAAHSGPRKSWLSPRQRWMTGEGI